MTKYLLTLIIICTFLSCWCDCGIVLKRDYIPNHLEEYRWGIRNTNRDIKTVPSEYRYVGKCIDSKRKFSVYRDTTYIYSIGDTIWLNNTERPAY